MKFRIKDFIIIYKQTLLIYSDLYRNHPCRRNLWFGETEHCPYSHRHCFEGLASLYTKKKGLNIECFNFSMIHHLPPPSAYAQSHLRKEILMVHVLHYKKPCFLGVFFVFFVLAFFCRNGKLRFENNSFSRLYLEFAIFL